MTLGPLMVDIAGTTLTEADRTLLKQPALGGVILFTRNYTDVEQLTALCSSIHGLRSPPLLIAVDQEGGRVQRFGAPFTRLPPASMLGHAYDIDRAQGLSLARTTGWLMAAELRACGVDLSFAPVVDVDHGICSVIGDRACHRDPEAIAELALAWIAGMREAGMRATAKHFPGHGGVAGDSHLTLPVDHRDYKTLVKELRPYRSAIAAGLDSVMLALVSYPAVDEKPAVYSRAWIQTELRERLGFRGAVLSDDLSMTGAAGMGSMRRRTLAALDAGCDMVLICNDRDAVETVVGRIEANRPVSQVRRASLHGRRAPDWRRLHHAERWRQSRAVIEALSDAPDLELDGR